MVPAVMTFAYLIKPDTPDDGLLRETDIAARILGVQLLGRITWNEWGEHFGAHLRQAAAADETVADTRPMPEVDSANYYDVWLDTLESLLIQRGLASATDLAELKEAWTEAYPHTPHGMPVELGGNDHSHDHAED
jgi:hypothetical protein